MHHTSNKKSEGDDIIEYWNFRSGKTMLSIRAGHHVEAMDLSPDGKFIAAVVEFRNGKLLSDYTLKIWDTQSGECVRTIEDFGFGLAVRYSPDGSYIASVGAGSVTVWDARTCRKLLDMDGNMQMIWDVDFSPEGSLIAACGQKRSASVATVRIWDVRTGLELLALEGNPGKGPAFTLAFSPDGKHIAAGCGEGSDLSSEIIIWGP